MTIGELTNRNLIPVWIKNNKENPMAKKISKDYMGISRLKSKNARNAIIQKLCDDFNLTPIIAEAFYAQFSQYYQEHANIELSSGQLAYEGISADEPAGKHIRIARKKTVRLKLYDINSDLEVLAEFGTAGLRRHRLARLTRQAYEQEALLSYEDLALLLTTSASTIKRDVQQLNREGKFIITRGSKLDMGPGLSHKTIIIDYYLKGYSFTEIEQITNHSEKSVKRYLADFIQIASLKKQDFKQNQIRLIAQKSMRIVQEYLELFKCYSAQNNERLNLLLSPSPPSDDAKKKSGNESLSGGKQDE